MFPLNFNFPFRKSNGELTTLGRMFENSGGGGSYTLPTASASTKGGIKIGSGLTMNGETLNNDNPTPYLLPTAGANTKGGVKVGSGLTMDGDTLNNDNPTPYTLPTASDTTKGGIKVGNGFNMDGDTLKNYATSYSVTDLGYGLYLRKLGRLRVITTSNNSATFPSDGVSLGEAALYNSFGTCLYTNNGTQNGLLQVMANRVKLLDSSGSPTSGTNVNGQVIYYV